MFVWVVNCPPGDTLVEGRGRHTDMPGLLQNGAFVNARGMVGEGQEQGAGAGGGDRCTGPRVETRLDLPLLASKLLANDNRMHCGSQYAFALFLLGSLPLKPTALSNGFRLNLTN